MDDHRTLDEFSRGQNEAESDDDHEADNHDDDHEADDHDVDDHGAADPEAAEPEAAEPEAADEDSTADKRGDESSPETQSETVEPPSTTYRWTPDGDACENCGTAVERRWRDGDAFVCADCKEW